MQKKMVCEIALFYLLVVEKNIVILHKYRRRIGLENDRVREILLPRLTETAGWFKMISQHEGFAVLNIRKIGDLLCL